MRKKRSSAVTWDYVVLSSNPGPGLVPFPPQVSRKQLQIRGPRLSWQLALSHRGETALDLVDDDRRLRPLSEETKEEMRRLLAPGRTAFQHDRSP